MLNRNNWSNLYHIQTVQPPESTIDAWSTQYIPFDLKDAWKKNFRQELFQAVNALPGDRNTVLHGIYEFAGDSRADVENVLFYNIDQSYFSALTLYGIKWERGYRLTKPCPITLYGTKHHHYMYQLVKQTHPFHHWRTGNVLARWWLTLPNLSILEHPSYLWYFLKSSSQPILFSGVHPIQKFGIRVFINVPKSARQRFLLSKTKAIIDGLIATLNYHDGIDESEICRRLAQKIKTQPGKIAPLLQAKEGALFGKSSLIRLWRNTVQWNPQDDQCLVGELLIRVNKQDPEIILVSEIFEIHPKPAG